MSEEKKKLVVAFLDFLKSEIKSGQLGDEAIEGLEGMKSLFKIFKQIEFIIIISIGLFFN